MNSRYLFYNKEIVKSQQPVGQIAKQLVSQLPADNIVQQPVGQLGTLSVVASQLRSYVDNTLISDFK
jgi:hypothetical protein